MVLKRKLYSTSEAALELGVGVDEVRGLITSGELRASKVDGRFVLDDRALDVARDLLDEDEEDEEYDEDDDESDDGDDD